MSASNPYDNSRLAIFLQKRTLELRGKKSQKEIAAEAGFVNSNMVAMLKSGASKLPLDRVPALAKALEVDPRLLFKLALEQVGGTTANAIEEIFGTIVTRNELEWLTAIREASDHGDPRLTSRTRSSLRALFGK